MPTIAIATSTTGEHYILRILTEDSGQILSTLLVALLNKLRVQLQIDLMLVLIGISGLTET
jgi:hypothetical protein